MKKALPFILITLLSYIFFQKSFNLSLFGDDWLVFWQTEHFLKSGWTPFDLFFTAYGSQYLISYLLKSLFNYQSTYYYLFSWVFRTIASISIYPLVMYVTKSKISAFLAVVFFTVTSIGLEVTNYTVHISSYISISFLCLFIYYLLKSQSNHLKYLLPASIFFILNLCFTPIRAAGVIAFSIFADIIWFFTHPNIPNFKYLAIRQLILIGIFIVLLLNTNIFLFISTKNSQITPNRSQFINETIQSINKVKYQVKNNNSRILTFPLITLGTMVIPQAEEHHQLATILGILLIFTSVYLILTKNKYSYFFIVFLVLCLSNLFFPWLWSYETIYPVTHRYLIFSALGMSLLVGIIANVRIHSSKLPSISLIILLCIFHLRYSNNYIDQLLVSHNQTEGNKIWVNPPKILNLGITKQPIVIYLQSDDQSAVNLHNSFGFGLGYRLALLSKLDISPSNIPVTLNNWPDLISAVTDGNSIHAIHGLPRQPIPLENIYAYRLEEKSNLINITNDVRHRLSQELNLF